MKLPPGYVPGVGVVAPPGARGGLGERLLRRAGWTDGQGLGKDGQGRADAVAVSMKADLAGVRGSREGFVWLTAPGKGPSCWGGGGAGRRPARTAPAASRSNLAPSHASFPLSFPPVTGRRRLRRPRRRLGGQVVGGGVRQSGGRRDGDGRRVFNLDLLF